MSVPAYPLVSSVLKKPGTCLSYEFFPPKDPGHLHRLYDVVSELKSAHRPDFCSVTWGAGGSTIRGSIDVVSHLTHGMGVLTLAHFTCLGMNRQLVDEFLDRFAGTGIHNLLVLRGDRPHGQAAPTSVSQPVTKEAASETFRYASELVAYIRSKSDCAADQLGLLVAGCPEGHPESVSAEADWDHLAHKVKQGADGIVTQFFFDNAAFYKFRDGLKKRNVNVPVSAGVMMVTKARMIQKMIELSKCSVPAELGQAIARFGDDDASMEAFGIDYAARQLDDLIGQGVRRFHFYTLNQAGPTIALLNRIQSRLGERAAPEPRTVHIEYREYMAYPDSRISDLFKKYGLNPDLPHSIVFNHALRRYEITQ